MKRTDDQTALGEKTVKEIFFVENCEDCPCYHARYCTAGGEIAGCCEWVEVEDVPPREGVPSWCWLHEGVLVVAKRDIS